jgi:hypothetical protein
MAMTFERSPDTDAVIRILRGCNDEISYLDLARQAGLSMQRMKAMLPSARRAIRAQSGVLFGVIRGEGLRVLRDTDKVRKPEAFKRKVMRGAGREIKDLSTISDFNGLDKADQHSVTTNRTILNVIRQQAQVKVEPQNVTITPLALPDTEKIISSKG